jgi:hypothetical protein
MYRLPAIAVLLAATAFQPSLAGQMRPMPRPSGPIQSNSFRPRVQSRSGSLGIMRPNSFGRRVSLVAPGDFRHNLRFNTSFVNACFTDPFFDPLFCRHFFIGDRFPFAQSLLLPYPVDMASYYETGEQSAATVADQVDLAKEIDRLTNEVQMLRAPDQPGHQKRSNRRTSFVHSGVGQPAGEVPPAALAFRDGHKEEVGSYSIIGGTLYTKADYWTSGSWTRKIQITDLDLPATLKLNQERGVNFALPAGPYEVVIR